WLNPQWQLTAGARAAWYETAYQEDRLDRTTTLILYLFGVLPGAPGVPVTIDNRSDDNVVTPKFQMSWVPNDANRVYVTASQGYRIGQNNPNFGPDPLDPANGIFIPANYDADSLWNYELGWK